MDSDRRPGLSHQEKNLAAGNGLLDRRLFLIGAGALIGQTANAQPLVVSEWSRQPGADFQSYGQPSRFEDRVARVTRTRPGLTGIGSSLSPIQHLEGTITPSSLHFERSHSGVPDIDPSAHRLLIHGLVKRPLIFDMDALARYPMHSRVTFIECGGNGALLYQPEAAQVDAQALHGLTSCSEWTGIRLATLLDETGVLPNAKWVIAEGADAASMSRSVPLAKAMDDAMLALYQNGERIRPSNGYPLRLLLPGFEGNMQVKWLRRLKLVESPVMSKDETSKYTLLQPNGLAQQFVFPMDVKSVITRPSPGLKMQGPGLYEISGLAWSGHGKIKDVEVSADGGSSWALAALQEPVLPKAHTRFRIAWRWNGAPTILMSRAFDEHGNVQPSRKALLEMRGARATYHFNGIQSWAINMAGELSNVYV